MAPRTITVAAEGPHDEAVIRRLLKAVGLEAGTVYLTGGKGKLDRSLAGYNNAARHSPWLVLRDLDRDERCAPGLVGQLLPKPAPMMCLRVAVRAVEAWLLADPVAMASFLRVPAELIPREPEALLDPKQELVNLARRSRERAIREDMVPMEPGRQVGRGYTGRIIDFARNHWEPQRAEKRSGSLGRCLRALQRWS